MTKGTGITRWAAGFALGAILAGSVSAGAVGSLEPVQHHWTKYRDRLTGNTIVVKDRCMAAEDSAAHLRLIGYTNKRSQLAVYGCWRHF